LLAEKQGKTQPVFQYFFLKITTPKPSSKSVAGRESQDSLVASRLSLVVNQLSPAKPGSFNRFLDCARNDKMDTLLHSNLQKLVSFLLSYKPVI
jgi:hypothetical protein